MEDLGTVCDHLVYFMAIGNILWPFGIVCVNLVYFSPFWYFGPKKNLATLLVFNMDCAAILSYRGILEPILLSRVTTPWVT
jgi:hypothetical protein